MRDGISVYPAYSRQAWSENSFQGQGLSWLFGASRYLSRLQRCRRIDFSHWERTNRVMFDRQADQKFVQWAKEIKERDNYTCQICKKFGVPLNSHHLNSWDMFIEQRYELANGITLCVGCHDKFHEIYGKGKNTKFQFDQFRQTIQLFKKALAKNHKIL